ncbi:hypothetical protein EJ08DRAFT_661889 [Tothia fuscella]|uniref:Uncharacterized protein n=1 Tax=Tothia fuscella TaxID=1048955 RepID=A0A9P4TWK8_9PEZI|nr:hypothetical protein EJ08DRAFT_661889 [Tothia fuscella]
MCQGARCARFMGWERHFLKSRSRSSQLLQTATMDDAILGIPGHICASVRLLHADTSVFYYKENRYPSQATYTNNVILTSDIIPFLDGSCLRKPNNCCLKISRVGLSLGAKYYLKKGEHYFKLPKDYDKDLKAIKIAINSLPAKTKPNYNNSILLSEILEGRDRTTKGIIKRKARKEASEDSNNELTSFGTPKKKRFSIKA